MQPEDAPPPRPRVLPRRGRRGSVGRFRLIIFGVIAIGLFLLMSLRGLAGFYTDFLWFDSLGQGQVFKAVLGAQVVLVLLFMFLFFLILFGNLTVAQRLAPRIRPAGPEEDLLVHYHTFIGKRDRLVRILFSAFFALIAGLRVSDKWQDWLLFTNREDVGVTDAQFDKDIGFYIFQLPFFNFVVDWVFGTLLVTIIFTAITHYLNGGIRFQTMGERVRPQVKAHLSVLLAVIALVRAANYWLARYELTTSDRGAVDGATYTDVKAQLPATNLLILISLLAVILLVVNIRRRGWVLPTLAVGLWAFVAVVVGSIYPAVIQNFRVEPAESEKEAPYIERNIAATREAYGLAEIDEVQLTDFDNSITANDLKNNSETVRNIRILDPLIVQATFDRLQGEREFYRFSDVLDTDRYEVNGETTQVLLGARELNLNETRSWENQHVAFTHGYGLALAPVSRVKGSGDPDFLIGDLPVSIDESMDLTLDRPQIYVGENLGGYAVLGASRNEVDYTDENQQTLAVRYEELGGDGGVGMGSLFRRVAFALRFGQIEPLISNFITEDSKVMFVRDVRERVEKLAPFLHFDADPYPILENGRIIYMIDGYTTTDRYPYAQNAPVAELPRKSGLRHNFNYVRNSVKATVDAFTGEVIFYVVDQQDPLINAYQRAFEGLFKPMDEMPASLIKHVRYPEDLFRVQTELWGKYHVDDTENFYQRAAEWAVSQDPGRTGEGAANLAIVNEQGIRIGSRDMRMSPYRTIVELPDSDEAEYVVLRAFVPLDEEDTRKELAAFIVGRSDKDDYAKLAVYRPPSSNFDGPALAEERIRNDEEVASLQTLLSQRGSTVLFGELLLVPIEDSILYVRPLYVQAEGDSTVPELVQVIVAVGEDVVMADSLQEALEILTNSSLSELFDGIGSGKSSRIETNEKDEAQSESVSTIELSDISENVAAIIAEIDRLQKASATALADDPADWEEFGRLQAQIQELVNALAFEAS